MSDIARVIAGSLLIFITLTFLSAALFLKPLASIGHPLGTPASSLRGKREGAEHDDFGLYLDGWTKVPVPREIVERPPAEMFYSIPLSANPSIEPDRQGYAFIPKLVTLKVNYVRELPFIGGFEYGVANWKWNANPVSIMSDKVIAGTAEKMLTLTHRGFWRTDSKDQALRQREGQSTALRWLASKTGWYRSFLVNAFALMVNPGFQLKDAAVNEDTYKDLQQYVMKDNATPPQRISERMRYWRANASAEATLAGNSEYDKLEQTAVNCFHIEGTTGAFWTERGLRLPLGRKIAAYRGQIAQGPLRTFNIATGVVVAEYNKRDQALEIYFYANNYLNVLDPTIPNILAPTLYTSVLPGEAVSSILPDSRKNTVLQSPSAVAKALYDRYMSMPVDYEYLFRDPSSLCTAAQRQKLVQIFRDLDFERFAHHHVQKPGTLAALDMVRTITNVIDCGTSYLQAKTKHSNAYDLMEALGWGHFIMESPPGDTMQMITYPHWNAFAFLHSTMENKNGLASGAVDSQV